MTSRRRSSGVSLSIAGGTTSEVMRAPWLPPNTSRRIGPSMSSQGYGSAAALTTIGRTGLPVKVAFAASGGSKVKPGKLVAIASTRAASRRFARPITALASWITVGIRRNVAAKTGGKVG